MRDTEHIESIQNQIGLTVDELCEKYGNPINRNKVFERIFNREKDTLLQIRSFDENPERFVERSLVWPLLDILGYEYETEKKAGKKRVDFLISNTSKPILGEVKRLGDSYKAYGRMLRYFDKTDFEIGFVTDGLYWEILRYEPSQGIASAKMIEYGELRGTVANYASKNNIIDAEIIELGPEVSPTAPEEFYSKLNSEYINNKL